MMYDYRQDLIDLINSANSDKDSLKLLKRSIETVLTIAEKSEPSANLDTRDVFKKIESITKNREKETHPIDGPKINDDIFKKVQSITKNREKETHPLKESKTTDDILNDYYRDHGMPMRRPIAQLSNIWNESIDKISGWGTSHDYMASMRNYYHTDAYFDLHNYTDDTRLINQIFRYGIVECDTSTNALFVRRNVAGNMLSDINDKVERYVLSKKDIKKMHIQQGDIVDLIWLALNPTNIRLVWRYSEISCDRILSHHAGSK